VRARIARLTDDRYLHTDLLAAGELVGGRALLEAVRGVPLPALAGG
jgi:hypothetical protein